MEGAGKQDVPIGYLQGATGKNWWRVKEREGEERSEKGERSGKETRCQDTWTIRERVIGTCPILNLVLCILTY